MWNFCGISFAVDGHTERVCTPNTLLVVPTLWSCHPHRSMLQQGRSKSSQCPSAERGPAGRKRGRSAVAYWLVGLRSLVLYNYSSSQ